MVVQRTLASTTRFSGVGLHSGRDVSVTVRPAPTDSGIAFARSDIHPMVDIPARAEFVVSTELATTLGRDGVTLATVEHLMAALYGLGIDNARVEVDGPELPVLDGSSMPYVRGFLATGGVVEQRRPKRFIVVRRPVEISDGLRKARFEPSRRFEVRCGIDFEHPLIGEQQIDLKITEHSFTKELASARTFGFGPEIDALHQRGLALGGSLRNAVVLDAYSVRNPEGLRFPDEFVRHKALDAVGDIALVGAPILGRFIGVRGGHAINTALVKHLLEQPKAFEYVTWEGAKEAAVESAERPSLSLGGLLPV
jgi:UDP-3-O-[3-hydroxymyristoyl] N-acetylglucosamine deacetylase